MNLTEFIKRQKSKIESEANERREKPVFNPLRFRHFWKHGLKYGSNLKKNLENLNWQMPLPLFIVISINRKQRRVDEMHT